MGRIIDNSLEPFSIALNIYPSSTSDTMTQLLQYKINDEFLNATDINAIEEEITFGTLSFSNIAVRLVHLIERNKGTYLGDDYKEIIFKDNTYVPKMGKRYRFDNNIWITVNTDNYRFPTKSAVIARCNNTLKWVDQNGNKIQEPCRLDGKVLLTTNDFNQDVATGDSKVSIIAQLNSNTLKIGENQRFIFGSPSNRICYKIRAGSMTTFFNQNTYDDTSSPLFKADIDFNQINIETDDLISGYADAFDNIYQLQTSIVSLTQQIGFAGNISTIVTLNGEIVSKNISWSSSSNSKATIDNSGNFTLLSNGNCIFTVSLIDNPTITKTVNITVAAIVANDYKIITNPSTDSIIELTEGSEQLFNVKLTNKGVDTGDVFTFLTSGIPINNYAITRIDGNNFKIKNNKLYNLDNLTVVMTSGIYTKTIEIKLKGLW